MAARAEGIVGPTGCLALAVFFGAKTASFPTCRHQVAMVLTANAAVSWRSEHINSPGGQVGDGVHGLACAT